jgi:5'-nucleotidase
MSRLIRRTPRSFGLKCLGFIQSAAQIQAHRRDREPDDVVATVVTTQGKRDPGLLQIDERHDTWGNPYYWLAFERRRSTTQEGTDLWAVYSGRISVTPLFLDLTHQGMREALTREIGSGQ